MLVKKNYRVTLNYIVIAVTTNKTYMNWTLIHTYLAEECTEEERRYFERWLNEDTHNRDFFLTVQRIWDVAPKQALSGVHLEESIKDDDSAWREFAENNIEPSSFENRFYQSSRDRSKRYNSIRQRKKLFQKPLYYTAAAVLLLIAVLFTFPPDINQESPQIIKHEYVSQEGEHITLKLNDGTTVTLNENSRIVIDDSFTTEKRKVYLDGEAFFEVTHDPQNPFKVALKNAQLKVLGTKFNVKSRPSFQTIQVAVIEGKVSLKTTERTNEAGVILTKGNLGVYNLRTDNFTIEHTLAANYISWMTGRLIFQNSSLLDVSRQLERLYGINIEFAASTLKNRRLSAILERKEVDVVLSVIARTLQIDYSIDNKNNVIWQSDKRLEKEINLH